MRESQARFSSTQRAVHLRSLPGTLGAAEPTSAARPLVTQVGADLPHEDPGSPRHRRRQLRRTLRDRGSRDDGLGIQLLDRRPANRARARVPYLETYLELAHSSALVIMDSKAAIMRVLGQMADYHEACAHMGARRHTELRPFYFPWTNGRLEQLAPAGVSPPLNAFSKEYFVDRSGGGEPDTGRTLPPRSMRISGRVLVSSHYGAGVADSLPAGFVAHSPVAGGTVRVIRNALVNGVASQAIVAEARCIVVARRRPCRVG